MQAPETAEQAVLASILMDPPCIADIADQLRPTDFGTLDYRNIYSAMLDCHGQGRRADIVNTHDRLDQLGVNIAASDIAALMGTADFMVTSVYVADYARSVVSHSRRRQVIDKATALIQRVHADHDADPVELAHQVMGDVNLIAGDDAGPRMYADVIAEFEERIALQVSGSWEERVLATGLHDLDHLLGGGIRPGELVYLGGRPGSGKSALMLQIAHNVARREQPALIFSGEMSMASLVERGVSEITGVSMRALRRKQIDQETFQALASAAERMSNMPVAIDDTSGLTTSQMLIRAQRFQRQHGLGLVLFDYLELAGDDSKHGDTSRVSAVSRQLKHIARTLDVPFIALSQLNRGVETRTPPVPRMSDLRQSGSIEADADIVLLIYRHDYYVNLGQVAYDAAREGIAEIHVSKQRNGENGIAKLRFDATSMSFKNIDWSHT